MSCGVGRRHNSDLTAALIRLLAWEPPYAAGMALEKTKKKKKKKSTGTYIVKQLKPLERSLSE